MSKLSYASITLLIFGVTPSMLLAKADNKPVHKLSPPTISATQTLPVNKQSTGAHYSVFSAKKADGSGFFSDRQPLNMPYKILRFDCFACDPSSNINWFTTPLFIRPYSQIITAAADKHKLDPALIRAVIHAESAFKPTVISKKGAIGLMQLMPKTAEQLGVADASIPAQNIPAGTQYLANLLKQYDGDIDLALAAYNAGSTNVRKYKGIPPFAETQAYVKRVSILHKRYQSGS